MKEYINDAIDKYIQKHTYPWHMPGHKRQPEYPHGGTGKLPDNQNDTVEKQPENQCGAASDMWSAIYARDFTEAKDLDDMHAPESFIADCLAEMRNVYGTYATYMLVNGTTCGIMSALHAACRRGDTVVVARNCHKSVYNAMCMLNLRPEYIMPEYVSAASAGVTAAANMGAGEDFLETADAAYVGTSRTADISGADSAADVDILGRTANASHPHILGDVKPADVERVLARLRASGKKVSAVVITSPTYEGVISDISGIAEAAHRYGAYLIVDQAQGAHLEFMPQHISAVRCGADIVVESLHKTMPALTQTSLLHVLTPELDIRVRRYLQIFQTSSPSYIFMQSMEKAVACGANNPEKFAAYEKRLEAFAARCENLGNIRLFAPNTLQPCSASLGFKGAASGGGVSLHTGKQTVYDHDEARLVWIIRPGTKVHGETLTGVMLADMLADRYGLIVEMASLDYVICISSVADSVGSYDRLYEAIEQIDAETEITARDDGQKNEMTVSKEVDCKTAESKTAENPDNCTQTQAVSVYAREACGRSVQTGMPQMAHLPGEAWDMPSELVPLAAAEGRAAAEFVYAYPPGIPVLVPGEVIDSSVICELQGMIAGGLHVSGVYHIGNDANNLQFVSREVIIKVGVEERNAEDIDCDWQSCVWTRGAAGSSASCVAAAGRTVSCREDGKHGGGLSGRKPCGGVWL